MRSFSLHHHAGITSTGITSTGTFAVPVNTGHRRGGGVSLVWGYWS